MFRVSRVRNELSRHARQFRRQASSSAHYDMLVVGGGSGGISSARRAALHGAKVAVVEYQALGGTCVNVGCVPKKLMYHASHLREQLHLAKSYGLDVDSEATFDLAAMKRKRDAYIERLNGIYQRNLEGSGVDLLQGWGSFQGKSRDKSGKIVYDITIETPAVEGSGDLATSQTVTASHVLLATGGRPAVPDIPGVDLLGVIDSDGFFDLDRMPERATVVGGGYIACEMAGILAGLGAETTVVARGPALLRGFDPMLQQGLQDALEKSGVTVLLQEEVAGLEEQRPGADGPPSLRAALKSGGALAGQGTVLFATGRAPLVDPLRLDVPGVDLDEEGHIVADEFQETSAEGVYAVGDVTGVAPLTPVAIAAGRLLADRLFGGTKARRARLEYRNVPTVMFSHPPIGTVGLTETEAAEQYGEARVRVYRSTFRPLMYGLAEEEHKRDTLMKVVCVKTPGHLEEGRTPDEVDNHMERVVGVHMIGDGADEMLQGFGVALSTGVLTKRDLDSSVAIHPTSSEELVTMQPWRPWHAGEPKEREELPDP